MANKEWTNHCKQYAFNHNIPYMEALKSIECQELYTKKEKKYNGIKKMRKEQNELVIKFFDGIIGREEFKQSYYELENKIKRKMDDSLRYRYHKIKRLKRLKENNI